MQFPLSSYLSPEPNLLFLKLHSYLNLSSTIKDEHSWKAAMKKAAYWNCAKDFFFLLALLMKRKSCSDHNCAINSILRVKELWRIANFRVFLEVLVEFQARTFKSHQHSRSFMQVFHQKLKIHQWILRFALTNFLSRLTYRLSRPFVSLSSVLLWMIPRDSQRSLTPEKAQKEDDVNGILDRQCWFFL